MDYILNASRRGELQSYGIKYLLIYKSIVILDP